VEDIEGLVKNDVITRQEGNDKLIKRESMDKEFNQKTLYSLRAGNVPEVKDAPATSVSGDTL